MAGSPRQAMQICANVVLDSQSLSSFLALMHISASLPLTAAPKTPLGARKLADASCCDKMYKTHLIQQHLHIFTVRHDVSFHFHCHCPVMHNIITHILIRLSCCSGNSNCVGLLFWSVCQTSDGSSKIVNGFNFFLFKWLLLLPHFHAFVLLLTVCLNPVVVLGCLLLHGCGSSAMLGGSVTL